MKIGIEVSTVLNHGHDIGAGRYIINLVKNLLTIDKKNSYVLTGRYGTSENLHIFNKLRSGFAKNRIELKFFKTGSRSLKLWDRLRFPPLEIIGLKVDMLHCPDFMVPPTLNKNIILTIHDLGFIRYPEFNFDWFIKKYTKEVKRNTTISKRIIADSVSTRDDIIKFFKTDPDKVEVVYLAADSIFRKLDKKKIVPGIIKKFNIDKKYLFSVGTIEPRKDFPTLIRAFNQLRKKEEDFDLKLIIAGRTGWKSETTFQEREASPYRDDILFIGKVSDTELLQLYNQAELFIYPSLFEGFGLPPLEAMSCGLPVILSETSSLTEIAGDAAVLVKPQDTAGIKKAVLKIISDPALREELSRNSIAHAARFNWQKTAQKTLGIYNRISLT